MLVLDQGYQEHQVSQSLGDQISEKLTGVLKKYWQYKSEKLNVIECLNQNFLVPSYCDKICAPGLKREI